MANEKRLIDANALLADLKEELEFETQMFTAEQNEWIDYGLRVAIKDVKYQPTVDAVEVVRCKDFKWYKEGELLAPNKFCFRLKHPTEDRHVGYNFSDDDFCSYGERKDE